MSYIYMKESDIPESCDKCIFTCICDMLDEDDKECPEPRACPIVSLEEHDREVIKSSRKKVINEIVDGMWEPFRGNKKEEKEI